MVIGQPMFLLQLVVCVLTMAAFGVHQFLLAVSYQQHASSKFSLSCNLQACFTKLMY